MAINFIPIKRKYLKVKQNTPSNSRPGATVIESDECRIKKPTVFNVCKILNILIFPRTEINI